VTLFEREIREQPESLARLLSQGRAGVESIARQLRAAKPGFALLAARGSSDNAARYAQYLFGGRNRLAVALAAPSLFTGYGTPPSLEGALVIGISQSGRSPDVVAVVEEASRQGALALAITNDPASPLAAAARLVLPLLAGEERAVAASKTYTHQLLALAMLSAALSGGTDAWRELDAIPGAASTALALAGMPDARPFKDAPALVALARGFNLSTAFEIALKLKETAYVAAEAWSWADFLHGPIAVVSRGLPALMIAPSSALGGEVEGSMASLAAKGASLIAISDREDVLAKASLALPMPAVPEWLSPIVAAVPGQLFALALSAAKGLDPDRPRGLSKVTETR
jgi:glucosamine--fructose-6-phosphate aminotransferase (isomerizing)